MTHRFGSGRPALALVPDTLPEPSPSVWFCSHCGSQHGTAEDEPDSRVCGDCGLGVLLQTRSDVAPRDGGAFLVLDRSLSVCAVSEAAERLLATMEGEKELPPVVAAAFRRRPKAKAGWAKMTPTQRKHELLAVFYYQTPEAREKRVGKLCDLAEKKAGVRSRGKGNNKSKSFERKGRKV